jgi:hypothetical protein
MKMLLVICCTLLVISGERFVVQMQNIGIRKRKIAVQEEAVRIIKKSHEADVAAQPAEEKL